MNESCDIVVQPKCLICVDGIDEASSWSFWKERIEETQVYENIFSNVKFVFLSRPYVFPRYYDLDYRECFYTLPSSGDVSVNELFDNYIAFYKIDLCGNYWIKGILRTPMSLKLFCDLYGNSRVGNLDKNSLVITRLFQKKIDSVEESYRKQEKETKQQSMIKTVLVLKGKIGAEERIYRVLDLKEKVLVLDCVKKTMPVWKTYEELSDCVEKEEESMAEAIDIIDAMEGESRKTAYQRYNMISGILPFLSEENMRTEAIKRASERYGISKQTVRNYLCEYLATMDVRSLAPGYKKAEKKLSADEKNMRKSLNKWYYTTKKRTLKNCYTLMLQHFYCNADGSLKEQYPSYYQL